MAFTALQIIAVASIAAILYSYVFYPLVLSLVAAVSQMRRDLRYVWRKQERRQGSASLLPAIAVVIAAYNEEQHISARVDNLLSLDYPPDLLSIHIGSDGSTDGTNARLAGICDPRVFAQIFPQNRGKASVLNDLVASTDAPVLVFSDANTQFDRQALRRLVAHFDQEQVGGVSGELRLLSARGDNQDSVYWKVEQYLKYLEARIGGLLGANGAIYAIRRELWKPLRPDTICDDFCIAMQVAASGKKLVYEPAAWAEEDTPDSIHDEFLRRVRIGIGNYQALIRHPEFLLRTTLATRFTYISHKVLRWVAPHLLVVALLASAALAPWSTAWQVLLGVQVLGYCSFGFLYRRSRQGHTAARVLRIPLFLFALNWALLIASWRYATGRYRGGAWQRTAR